MLKNQLLDHALAELIKRVLTALGAFFVTSAALANPVVNNVAAGQVSIQQTPTTTTVNQTSSKAIINWQSFNIGSNEATHFQQPTGGVALNRISPTAGASQIYGHLTATGQIILSNPAGIYFGPSAYVNVGGLIATTGHITDQNFLNGIYQFEKVPGYSGAVINEGQIYAAENGLVALVAPGVVNNGTISAHVGHVVLASGDAFTLNFSGDNLINFKIDAKTSNRGVDQNGHPLDQGVLNTGHIFADGGMVLVTAQAVRGVLDNSIDMRGAIQARSIYEQAGKIIISGDPDAGITHVSAILDASAGDTGIQGGFIETSGHLVDLAGIKVNLSASNGKTGTWLIDPADLTICTACTTTASAFSAGSTNSNLLVNDLTTALASANVIVQTSVNGTGGNGDIFVNTPISWSSGNKLTLSAYRNITSSASITNTGGASVVLQADNTGTGTGTVSFTSGNNVALSGGSGTVKIYYNPTTFGTQDSLYTGGTTPTQYMLINSLGAAGDTTTRSLATLANTSSLWSDNFALSANIDASSTSSWNSGAGFSPIGNSTTAFSGLFDGQNYKISNLFISQSGASNMGFFGQTSSSAVISNLAINGNVTGNGNVGLLVGNNAGTISNVFVYGLVNGNSNNVGGLVGTNAGTINDTYSMASVTAASSSNVGGLVGNNSGTIGTSFATGDVSGSTSTGGLVGTNSGTVTNSYWDTNTSGQATSAAGTGATTANMMLQATYSGFNFTNTWGIVSGKSYPYLKSFYTNTPRAISGILSNTDPFTNINTYANANQTIKLATNSVILDNTQTGANGFYYFLEGNNVLTDDYPFLVYTSGSTTKANTITVAPPSGGSIVDLAMQPNVVLVADNGVDTPVPILFPTGTITYDYIINQLSDYSEANLGFVMQFYLGRNFDETTMFNGSYPLISGDLYAQIIKDPVYSWYLTGKYSVINYVAIATTDQTGIHFVPPSITTLSQLDDYVANYQALLNSAFTKTYNMITNDSLAYALGNLTGNDLLYTASGSDINVKDGYNFSTGNHVNFGLTGNLTAMNGSVVFNGPLQVGPLVNAYNQNVTVQTVNGGDIKTMDLVLWAMGDSVTTDTLNLNSASNIFFNKSVLGVVDDFNTLLLTAGSLRLSAAYTDRSITTGFLSNIVVNGLTIDQGKWYQDNLFYASYFFGGQNEGALDSAPMLSTFYFNLGPMDKVEFIRASGGDGSVGSPYLIGDYYGLQGIGSSPYTLSLSYKIVNTFSYRALTEPPVSWNDGLGFRPIGDIAHPFTGSIDGLFNGRISQINKITIDRPLESNVGIFGVTSPTAIIKNLFFDNIAVIGNDNVGMLVGTNNGTISHVYGSFLQVQGNNNVGTLVGVNDGYIDNISLVSSYVNGNNFLGGISGINAALASIDKVLAHSYINNLGNTLAITGGIVGNNLGSISNSFWDTDFSGQTKSAGTSSGTITQVNGGCFQGACTNQGSVNLSLLSTYTAKGWNFNSDEWGILNGYSYPYLEPILGWTGFGSTRETLSVGPYNPDNYTFELLPNDMSVIAGKTSPRIAEQYVALQGGVIVYGIYKFPIYTSYRFFTITGADGSFYRPYYLSHFVNDAVAVGIQSGYGNASSNVLVVPITNYTSSTKIIKLTLPVTINSTAPNNYTPTNSPANIGLNLTNSQILQFYRLAYGANNFFTPGYEQFNSQAIGQAIGEIYANYILSRFNINSAIYLDLTNYGNNTYLLDSSKLKHYIMDIMNTVKNDIRASDLIMNSKVDIVPVAPNCEP